MTTYLAPLTLLNKTFFKLNYLNLILTGSVPVQLSEP